MFLLHFFRYIRGYVRFCVQGVFVERFLNLVARDRIPIWSGRKRGDTFTGCTTAKSYSKLRRHAKKTGVRMRIVGKQGAPFERRKYKKRGGLLIGLALFVAFIVGMSQFIWRIEVHGNKEVEDSEVITMLAKIGIAPGTLRASIDVRDAEHRALLALHEMSWVALNIDGSTIYVEVNESTPPPKMVDPNDPCNVVASRSGQILSMNVYTGQELVQIGDTVLEGDIIVSGITQDKRGQSLFKHAKADVIAQVQHEVIVKEPLNQTVFKETGEIRKRGYLGMFGLELPLYLPWKIPQPYRVERIETQLRIASVELPLSYLRETYVLMQEVPVTYTEVEAKRLALKELAALQRAQLSTATILNKNITGKLTGDTYTVRASYICTMNVAEEREIRVGE